MMRRALVSCVVVALAALGLGAGESPARGPSPDGWAPLLARIPDAGSYRDPVVINDYAAARSALGMAAPSGNGRARLVALGRLVSQAELAPTALVRGRPLDPERGLRHEL